MEIDNYWKQFGKMNKEVYLIVGGAHGFSELIGFCFILANIIFLLR